MSTEIYKIMSSIIGDLGAIKKDQKNKFHNYNFRGIDQVYNAIHPLLAQYKVFLTFEVLSHETVERLSKKQETWQYSTVKVLYKFIASDGSSVESISVGEGADTGDKSINKALSAAQKYLFLQMFCIPTEDKELVDSEQDSPQFNKPYQASKTPTQSPQKHYQAPKPVSIKTGSTGVSGSTQTHKLNSKSKPLGNIISEPQRKRLFAIGKDVPDVDRKAILKAEGFESSSEITVDRYEHICQKMAEKREMLALQKDKPQKVL